MLSVANIQLHVISMQELKKTPFYEKHVSLGARMVDFEGWLMPVQYKGVGEEHLNCRSKCSVFDISHVGEFMLMGVDAEKFLNYMVTNDVSALKPQMAQYACMCYPNGTVVDDLFYYRYSDTKFKIIVNASNIQKDFDWLSTHKSRYAVELKNESAERARLAIQGPTAESALNPITEFDLSQLKRFGFVETLLKGIPVFIARTGYTGEDGFELSCSLADATRVWDLIFESGKEYGMEPAGLGTRDTLRLEACYSLYGHEINDEITPIEASIGWAVKEKASDFIGKEVLLKQKREGTARILKGLELEEKGILRRGYKIFSMDEKEIGFITSGAFGPSVNKTIALALIKKEHDEIGTHLKVQIREKLKTAKIVQTPWVSYKKK